MWLHPRLPALILLAALLAAPAQAAEIDKYLPDDAQAVVTINFRQIIDSAIIKKFALKQVEQGIKDDRNVREVVNLLGLDPLKDITSLTIASPGQQDEKKVMVIVHGSFDLTKIHDAADKFSKDDSSKLTIHKHENLRLYEAKGGGGKKDVPVFASLLNKEILVISPTRKYVEDAVSKSTGKKEGKPAKNLQALVGKQDGKQSLWLAALVTADARKQLGINEKVKEFTEKLESVSGGITLSDDVKIALNIQSSDPKAAKELRQQLEGVKALGVILVNNTAELQEFAPILLDVLNAFKFSQDQGAVGIELTIPGTLIEKAVKKIQ